MSSTTPRPELAACASAHRADKDACAVLEPWLPGSRPLGGAMRRLRVLLLGMRSLGWRGLDWEIRRPVLAVAHRITCFRACRSGISR